MPVRFVCQNCLKVLSVTRRKIGEQVECPACHAKVGVPTPEVGGRQLETRGEAEVRPVGLSPVNVCDRSLNPAADSTAKEFATAPSMSSGTTADNNASTPSERSSANPSVVSVAEEQTMPPEAAPFGPPATRVPSAPAAIAPAALTISSITPAMPVEHGVDSARTDTPPLSSAAATMGAATNLPSPPESRLSEGRASATGGRIRATGGGGTVPISRLTIYMQGLLLIAIATLAFILGLLYGRHTARKDNPTTPASIQVAGNLLYQDAGGATFGDSESVVMVVPVAARPEKRADAHSVRPDAPQIAHNHPSLLAVRDCGGDLVRADAGGGFAVTVPKSGEYYVLLLSSHVPRGAEERPSPETLAQIADYVAPADELLGQNAYEWRRETIRSAANWQHTFHMP